MDALHSLRFGVSENRNAGRRACILIPLLYFIFYVSVGQPLTLVFIGALAQALMLPFLCFAALYFHYAQTHRALFPEDLGPSAVDFKPAHDLRRVLSAVRQTVPISP